MKSSLRNERHEALTAEQLPPVRPPTEAQTHVGLDDRAVGSNSDILANLKALQESSAGMTLERHWGEAERRVVAVLEACCHLESQKEAEEEVREAFEDEPRPSRVAVDAEGFHLLHYASMYGSTEAIRQLTRARANLNSRTKVHETPLIVAALYRNAEACALLLAHGARQDLSDWQGRTALAAARASHCGHGVSNTGQAKAHCCELLATKWAEWRPPKKADEFRAQGNEYFKKKNYREAVASYSLGLSFAEDVGLYANRAACYLGLERFVEAKLDAQKAVGLAGEAGHEKAAWRLAKSALALGELDRAEEALRDALKCFPTSAALLQLRHDVAAERRVRLGAS